jgi:hypothetical protein
VPLVLPAGVARFCMRCGAGCGASAAFCVGCGTALPALS